MEGSTYVYRYVHMQLQTQSIQYASYIIVASCCASKVDLLSQVPQSSFFPLQSTFDFTFHFHDISEIFHLELFCARTTHLCYIRSINYIIVAGSIMLCT